MSDSMFSWDFPGYFQGGVLETPFPYDGDVGVFPEFGPSESNMVFQTSCSTPLEQDYLPSTLRVFVKRYGFSTTPLPTTSNEGKRKANELELPSCPPSKKDKAGALGEVISHIKSLQQQLRVLIFHQMTSAAGGYQQQAPYLLPSREQDIQSPQFPSFAGGYQQQAPYLLPMGTGEMCYLPNPMMPAPMPSLQPDILAAPRYLVAPSVHVRKFNFQISNHNKFLGRLAHPMSCYHFLVSIACHTRDSPYVHQAGQCRFELVGVHHFQFSGTL